MKENLNAYAHNITSAAGENGIIIEVFKRLEIENGVCVEFGAADGMWNSNVFPLWDDLGWYSLLIEPDENEYKKLCEAISDNSRVVALREKISPYGFSDKHVHTASSSPRSIASLNSQCLDAIFHNFNMHDKFPFKIEENFDLLSIDIDGDDYYVWKNLNNFNPKCIVIEYNRTIPPYMELVDDIKEDLSIGASIKSFVLLGKEKGYSLVACTGSNLIFVNNDYIKKLGNITTEVVDLFDLNFLTCLISTQKQNVLYMTKKRPPNYFMTYEELDKAGQGTHVNFDDPEHTPWIPIADNNGLYAVELRHVSPKTRNKIICNDIMFKFENVSTGAPQVVCVDINDMENIVLRSLNKEMSKLTK